MADPRILINRAPLLGRPILDRHLGLRPGPGIFVSPQPPAIPAPQPPAIPASIPAPPPPLVPAAPGESPFDKLPFPSAGDRIKADDFKVLSQSLRILHDVAVLSANLFGRLYGEVRLVLGTRGYQVHRAMTVFGNEITDPADTSMDSRKVIQVLPAAPGSTLVMVVLAEAVDTRRFAPNLIGLSHTEASERLQSMLGDVSFPGAPPTAPQLVGLSLSDALTSVGR